MGEHSRMKPSMSRREAVVRMQRGAAGLALAGLGGCVNSLFKESWSGDPRLRARPSTPASVHAGGRFAIDTPDVQGVAHVPIGVDAAGPAPLMIYLHGANQVPDAFVDDGFKAVANAEGVIVLAPYAQEYTWDAIYGGFGRDIDRLDAALRWVYERWQVDPARIALTGFSDGGTYALAVGRANGDLFRQVVAYSPGFLVEVEARGKPPILITHGTQDTVLPIDRASRVIVPKLRDAGYNVDYREFDGPHGMPLSVANEVMTAL